MCVYALCIVVYLYRLYTKVKVSLGFIIPSDEVTRLINAMKTIPRYLTGLYHDHNNNVNHIHAIKRLSTNITFISNDAPWKKSSTFFYHNLTRPFYMTLV